MEQPRKRKGELPAARERENDGGGDMMEMAIDPTDGIIRGRGKGKGRGIETRDVDHDHGVSGGDGVMDIHLGNIARGAIHQIHGDGIATEIVGTREEDKAMVQTVAVFKPSVPISPLLRYSEDLDMAHCPLLKFRGADNPLEWNLYSVKPNLD